MRFLIILGLMALLAISLAAAWPANSSDESENNNTSDSSDSNNNSTDSGSEQEGSGDDHDVISPRPRWPRWGGIGPVVLIPRPTKLGTL
ncbi:hypothetical protein KR038_003811 [Drosophila bunnanda]|nr:hypothetical protein KR038_003811 [Drosophila bunnanda]